MSFGKGFGIGFLIFVILNLVFTLVTSFLIGGNIAAMFTDVNSIIITLLGGALLPPTIVFLLIYMFLGMGGTSMLSSSLGIALLVQVLAYLLVPLISSIITGKLAGGKGAAFFAWFLISVLSAAIIAIMVYMDFLAYTGGETSMLMMFGLGMGETIMIMLILFGVINGIFYGAFAQLVSSDDLY